MSVQKYLVYVRTLDTFSNRALFEYFANEKVIIELLGIVCYTSTFLLLTGPRNEDQRRQPMGLL